MKKVMFVIIYIISVIALISIIPLLVSYSPVSDTSAFWTSQMGKFLILIIQIIVVIVSACIPIAMLKSSMGSAKSKYGNQGTAKEGTVSELNGLTVPVNVKKGGGYTLSKRVRLSAEKSYEHVAIIGPTGSGKSTSFFIPSLLDADGTHSFVVTDPKGELCKITSPYLKSLGMDIVRLDPLHPEKNTFFYNPILIAEDNTQLREVAQLILMNGAKSIELAMGSSGGGGQSEWINMSIPLFTAALAYVKNFGEQQTVNEAIDIILRKNLKEMESLFIQDKVAYKNFLIFKSSSESEKTIASIKSVLTSNVQLFLDEKIEAFTKTPYTLSTSTGKKIIDEKKLFNPKALRERPTALFVCVEETKSDYAAPLMSVFYSQLLTTHMSYFDEKYKTPILYMLDEFANIGVIPLIAKIAATARSRKIGLSIGLQGVEQLKRNYGDENANDILNNLKSKLIFSGLTGESPEYISKLAGYTTIETTNVSPGADGKISGLLFANKSKTGSRRELYTEDEIRRLDENKVLIIAHNRNVVKDDKNQYFKQARYNNKLK